MGATIPKARAMAASAIIRNLGEMRLSMAAFYHRFRLSPFAPKPSRLERRRDGQIGLALGIDHEESVCPFAQLAVSTPWSDRQTRCIMRRSRLFMGGKL